jgi:hypothetical protein
LYVIRTSTFFYLCFLVLSFTSFDRIHSCYSRPCNKHKH